MWMAGSAAVNLHLDRWPMPLLRSASSRSATDWQQKLSPLSTRLCQSALTPASTHCYCCNLFVGRHNDTATLASAAASLSSLRTMPLLPNHSISSLLAEKFLIQIARQTDGLIDGSIMSSTRQSMIHFRYERWFDLVRLP